MRRKLAALCLAAACACTLACGCKKKGNFRDTVYSMGTTATFSASDITEKQFKATFDRIKEFLADAEASLSTTLSSSCVYKFNAAAAGEKVELDGTAYTVLSLAKTVYETTDSYYNPAVYNSVELFGFTSSFELPDELPDQATVAALKELSNHFAEVGLSEEEGKYYATKPQSVAEVGGQTYTLRIDLGGIGKGWCADRVAEIMKEEGITYGYFDFGSSSMTIGQYEKSDTHLYTVSARDPRGLDESYFSVPLKDTALSTSGDYEQFYTFDGVRYCHIIDPTTGAPIATGIASVTVIGGSAAEDDALTTALSAMGVERAVKFINDNLADRIAVMLYFDGEQGKIITNRPDAITVLNGEYTLTNEVSDGKIILK